MAEEEKAAACAAAKKAKKSRQKAKKQQKSAGQHAQQMPSSHQQVSESTSFVQAVVGQPSCRGSTPCAPVLEQQAVPSTRATQQQQQQCKDVGVNIQDAHRRQAHSEAWPSAQPPSKAGAPGSCVVSSGPTDPSVPVGPVTPHAVDSMVTLHLQQTSARCSASSSAWEDPANGLVEPGRSEHTCLRPLSSLQQLFCCPITKVTGSFDSAVMLIKMLRQAL